MDNRISRRADQPTTFGGKSPPLLRPWATVSAVFLSERFSVNDFCSYLLMSHAFTSDEKLNKVIDCLIDCFIDGLIDSYEEYE